MNILQVISSTRTSGAEKHMALLSETLRGRGHDVVAVCPPGGWLPEQLRTRGVPAIELEMHGLRSAHAIREIRRLIRETGADIVHTHLTRAAYLGYFAARNSHVPVASSVHVATRDLVYRWMPRGNHWFITVSDYLRAALIARGVQPTRVQTVYNGTDLEEPEAIPALHGLSVRAEIGLPADAEIVCQLGRIDEFKGARLLVQAARPIVDRRPNAYFLFVGKAEPGFQQGLWEMASASGVGDRLRFTGVRNDVARLLDAADVVTVPSRTETFGMVVVEAMAMGRAVVATRAGGIPEIVTDGETGLLIDRTPPALAEAVIALLDDPDRTRAMGQNGRRRAHEMFTTQVMAGHMEEAYARILAQSRRR